MQIHEGPLKMASELKWNIAMSFLEMAIQFQEETEQYMRAKLNWNKKISVGLYRAAAMISQEKQKQSKSRGEGGSNIKLKAKQNGSMQTQADEITREKYKC